MNAVRSDSAVPAAHPLRLSAPSVALNVIAFQLGWFACVLGAAYDKPWLGTGVAAAVVGFHLARAARPSEEVKLIATVVLLGVLWDSALAAGGLLHFNSGALIEGYAPHWIISLWALFATTLNVSLKWLRGRWLVAAVLGAVAGPLSYWGGARLGAVVLVEPAGALAALAIGWAAIMPALMALARRYDGVQMIEARSA